MCNRRNMDICVGTHMSFLPPINLNFFPSSHHLRQKDTVQDNRYLRTSKTKEETQLLKRFSALLNTRSPSQPCSEFTKLRICHGAISTPESAQDTGTGTHSRCPSTHRVTGWLFLHSHPSGSCTHLPCWAPP